MKVVKQLAVIAALLVSFTDGALAISSDDFTFYNYSGRTIVGLYVSPHNEDSWLTNILRTRLVNTGSTDVYWYDKPGTDYFDLRIEYANGATSSSRRFFQEWALTYLPRGQVLLLIRAASEAWE